jgi:uncharacterized damage-inducible protein DinB
VHARLTEAMKFLDDRRTELLQSVADADSDRLRARPAPEKWSVAEILEHLRIVEAGVARLITKRVTKAREAGIAQEGSTESILASLDQYASILQYAPITAPETVRPRSDVDPEEALAGLGRSRDDLRAAAELANGIALGDIKHTHPVLGEIDLYQWLIFIGQHETRHRRQIERTLKEIPD